jgi:hypothetical protein
VPNLTPRPSRAAGTSAAVPAAGQANPAGRIGHAELSFCLSPARGAGGTLNVIGDAYFFSRCFDEASTRSFRPHNAIGSSYSPSAGAMSVRAKSAPLNSSGSPWARASA